MFVLLLRVERDVCLLLAVERVKCPRISARFNYRSTVQRLETDWRMRVQCRPHISQSLFSKEGNQPGTCNAENS
jgi:hypothetical protein